MLAINRKIQNKRKENKENKDLLSSTINLDSVGQSFYSLNFIHLIIIEEGRVFEKITYSSFSIIRAKFIHDLKKAIIHDLLGTFREY